MPAVASNSTPIQHQRKCEKCKRLFVWVYDLAVIAKRQDFQCPPCRKKPAKDTNPAEPAWTFRKGHKPTLKSLRRAR